MEAVVATAEEAGRTPAQVALRRLLGRPGVTAPIVGARTADQLADGLGAVGWELTAEQAERLDAASARPLPYPYDVLHRFRDRGPYDDRAGRPGSSPPTGPGASYSTTASSRAVVLSRRPPSSVTATMSSIRTPKRPGR